MNSIIEISIYGDLYFFENDFTNSQLTEVSDYIRQYKYNNNSEISIYKLINGIKKDLNIQLNLLEIATVIAI